MKFCAFSIFVILVVLPSIHCVLPGGHQEIPVDDPEVIRLSEVALTKINEGKLGAERKSLVEIVKAQRQIVSGTLTTLTLRLSAAEREHFCEVKIWEQPWLNKTEVTVKECGEGGDAGSKKKRQVVPEQAASKQYNH